MDVEYIDHMGSDLTVVNAARVSFNKESELNEDGTLSVKDQKLINFLARNKHESPFAHPQVTFRVKAPIFVARQLAKHQVGFAWNEVSRRYVDSEPTFYIPNKWRKRSEDKKQGSSDEEVKDHGWYPDDYIEGDWSGNHFSWKQSYLIPLGVYRDMISKGVCPEQARMVLPQSMYTEWYWTGSLLAWSRMCNLRLKPDSQEETRRIAQAVSDHMSQLFPVSWSVLVE